MKKFKLQIVLSIDLFLLILLGGSVLFFSFFAEDYYLSQKKSAIKIAYSSLRQLELDELSEEEEEAFLTLEEEAYSIIICDENFLPIYNSKVKVTDELIQERFRNQLELYLEDAPVLYYPEITGQPVSLHGLILQDGHSFYVYIYENTRIMHHGILYARNFLLKLFLFTMVLGTLFAFLLSSRIAGQLADIQQMVSHIARNDFSMRLSGKKPHNELGQLSTEINLMADKIQRNINDLNNYNYLLLKQNRNMAEFEDMRKKLVSNITHELKTPLAIISSQVELLQYEYDNTKKDYYFSSILEETDKMSRLISSILQNSRIENSIQNAKLRWGNLSDLLLELAPKYENWLSSLRIRFSTSIEEDCVAYMDPLQIEQALNNYMMNASHHTKPGRSVHLSLKSEANCFYLSVYNDGARIPSTELDNIWTSFYQSGEHRKDGATEIGLGLYIVKDIMNHHNGSCGALNHESGVEFWMKLPKG